jgi:hypothetical protein
LAAVGRREQVGGRLAGRCVGHKISAIQIFNLKAGVWVINNKSSKFCARKSGIVFALLQLSKQFVPRITTGE